MAPDTTYEVVVKGAPYWPSQGSGVEEQEHVVSTFTSGAEADHTAPTFGGLTGYRLTRVVNEHGVGCPIPEGLEPYAGYRVEFKWTPAADDSIRYNLYQVATDGELQLRRSRVRSVTAFAFCEGGGVYLEDFQLDKQGTYLVRAVDMAGNEDDNQIRHTFDLKCPLKEPVETAPEPEDYSVGQNPTPSTPSSDDGEAAETGGCHLAGSYPANPFVILLLAGVLLCTLGRRRLRLAMGWQSSSTSEADDGPKSARA